MLKRKISEKLKNWAEHKDKKCLVVQGARQTGKTYIIDVKKVKEALSDGKIYMKDIKDIAGDLFK